MSDHRAFLQQFFDEVWKQGRVGTIDEKVSEDCLVYGLGEPMRGNAGFKDFHAAFNSGYRDFVIQVEEIMSDGERCAFRSTFSAVHKATGRRASVSGGGMLRIRDGRIVEAWNNWDFLGVAQQVGVLPANTLMATLLG